ERTVSELIIATGTGEDQSAQKLGHYPQAWAIAVSYALHLSSLSPRPFLILLTFFNVGIA
ncbi:hypothetical protein, partial [Bifidobacterium longum]|uniref:hypothetical protein n=1 Tax=Bifidobacterium longum TaxID=216816 RepID=UPI003219709E